MGLPGAAVADDPRQFLRQTPAWGQPHPAVGVAEAGVAGGNEDISHQCQLETAGGGDAVDAHDDGAIKSAQRSVDVVVAVNRKCGEAIGMIAERLQIQARAECAALSGQDSDPDILVSLQLAKGIAQIPQQRGRQRVHRRRAIQGQRGDGTIAFDQQFSFRHAATPYLPCHTGARFSTKAVTPSRASALAIHSACSRASSEMASATGCSMAKLSAALA